MIYTSSSSSSKNNSSSSSSNNNSSISSTSSNKYRWVFNLPNKSGPIVANAIKGFFRGLRNGFGRYPTKFHFDGGTEITDLLTTWLAKRGIKFSTSAPYIHEQNGLVERSVRVILDRSLVFPRYRAIGAKGEAIIPLEKRSESLKFTSRTEECKLLAVLGSKTYLVYIPSRRAVFKTSTVKFVEDNTVLSQPTDNTALEGELVDLDLDLEGAVSPDPSNFNTEKPISIEIGPRVFYNAKTCHFIVTYVDDCLFIGPNIGYITDLKKRLNKVYAIEDLGPAAYFLGMQIIRDRPNRRLWLNQSHQLQLEEDIASHLCNSTEIKLYQSLVGTAIYIMLLTRVDISFTVQWLSRSLNRPIKLHLNAAKNLFKYLNSTKDYSICFSYNGNTVANLGPKLSNSSNTTTKLSRDFHSKEGPRPLTTTSTTIVDSRNSKGSSRTSIINSSLVPIGFSDSDFAGDKATSKSTYGYLYKLAGRPISWKTKRATTIALSTLEAETNGLTEAIREVQWIIGLFSELHRPIDYPITLYRDNQGSITVANDPALYTRTKHTLLKFQYVREQVKAKIVIIIYLNTKW
ncbi:hypothetical protein P8C59_002703 [Phyllachora maydis]|uniref:Integrase catalytic domain-containing protein n=1 Tax=Phyllachora maydis TaxID=1825666 RepID=A0AAD9HYW8_9PEZI|nr:hypothetical protein P8C59_002703 [Phyllachora maydis]